MRRSRVPLTALISACVVMSSCLVIPSNASATAFSYWLTAGPSASNSSYEWYYGHYHSPEVEAPEIEVDYDTDWFDLYPIVASSCHVFETNDFTHNDTWEDHGESEDYTIVGYMPHEDATVLSVSIVARFVFYRPALTLAFSTNNGSSWTTSGSYPASYSPFLGVLFWNVTSLATWTPALLNNTELCARATTYPTELIHYYLDYLGYWIIWGGEYEGGGGGGEGEGEDEGYGPFDTDAYFSVGNIVGLLGLVGFIGLIAIPAGAIIIYRNDPGQGLINMFIKMLAIFMFCLTLFMYSITAD